MTKLLTTNSKNKEVFDALAEKIGWEFAEYMMKETTRVWRMYGYVSIFKRYANKYLQALIDYDDRR